MAPVRWIVQSSGVGEPGVVAVLRPEDAGDSEDEAQDEGDDAGNGELGGATRKRGRVRFWLHLWSSIRLILLVLRLRLLLGPFSPFVLG